MVSRRATVTTTNSSSSSSNNNAKDKTKTIFFHKLGANVLLHSVEVLLRQPQLLGDVAVPAAVALRNALDKRAPVLRPQLDEVVEAGRLHVGGADALLSKVDELVAGDFGADAGEHVVADGVIGGRAGEVVEQTCENASTIAAGWLFVFFVYVS